jgi:hypothetical protein
MTAKMSRLIYSFLQRLFTSGAIFTAALNWISFMYDLCWLLTENDVGRVAQLVQWLSTGWMVRGSNPGGGEIFRTCPDRPWGPPSLLYNGYWIFSGDKEWPGRAADHSPPSSAAVMEEYSYTSTHPLGHVGRVMGLLYLYLLRMTSTRPEWTALSSRYPRICWGLTYWSFSPNSWLHLCISCSSRCRDFECSMDFVWLSDCK